MKCEYCNADISKALWKDIIYFNNNVIHVESIVHFNEQDDAYDCSDLINALSDEALLYTFDKEVSEALGVVDGLGAFCINCGEDIWEPCE